MQITSNSSILDLNKRVSSTISAQKIVPSMFFYINDTKDTFSSFERFDAFNKGTSSSVESVLITYNFLIILPKISQPQSYTVSIRVTSPVAIQRKMDQDSFFGVPKIFRIMGGPRTAVVNVKYVDYAVARTVLNAVDEWFNALPQSRISGFWKFIRKNTEWIPLITRYIAGLGVALIAFFYAPHFLSGSPSPVLLAQYLIAVFAAVFAAYKLAGHLGSAAEDSIDNWVSLSYLSLTDGDRNEIELAKTRNQKALVWGFLRFIGGLFVAVIAKLIMLIYFE